MKTQNPTIQLAAIFALAALCLHGFPVTAQETNPPPEGSGTEQPAPPTIDTLEAAARAAVTVAEQAAAIAELALRPGLGVHYYRKIKELSDFDTQAADAEILRLFKFLSKVQNDEVVMAVAEFLTQDSRRPRVANDPNFVPTAEAAAEALGRMQLPDAPIAKPVEEYTPEDVQIWRAWLEQFE